MPGSNGTGGRSARPRSSAGASPPTLASIKRAHAAWQQAETAAKAQQDQADAAWEAVWEKQWLLADKVKAAADSGESIRGIARALGVPHRGLNHLCDGARAFPHERVVKRSVRAHLTALEKCGGNSEEALEYVRRLAQRGSPWGGHDSSWGHARNTITDPDRRAKVLEDMMESDEGREAMGEFFREYMEALVTDDEYDDDEEEEEDTDDEQDDDATANGKARGKRGASTGQQKGKRKKKNDEDKRDSLRRKQLLRVTRGPWEARAVLAAAAAATDDTDQVTFLSEFEARILGDAATEAREHLATIETWVAAQDVLADLPAGTATITDEALAAFMAGGAS